MQARHAHFDTRRSSSQGFTAVKLLVVIAVIAVVIC